MNGRLEARGLGRLSEHGPLHAAIRRSEATIARLAGGVWRRRTDLAAKDVQHLVRSIHYETQSALATWIGDAKVREPRAGHSLIPADQLARLGLKLKPGDILLERRNWYLSNAFLPGYWPHAALYVGTSDDLARMGLDRDPRVQAYWEAFSAADPDGHRKVIVEALSEGVVFASLEHSIGYADSAAVLRPNLPPAEIKEAIASAFSHARKPYDFEFDFNTRDKLVCTEVVYRAYGANSGRLRFPVRSVMGRQTMPAIELVRKLKQEIGKQPQLTLVAYIEGDEATGKATFHEDAARFIQTLDRAGLTLLQGFEEDPAQRVGPLGWTLLALVGLLTAGNLAYRLRRPQR
jgi:hypothetical protein